MGMYEITEILRIYKDISSDNTYTVISVFLKAIETCHAPTIFFCLDEIGDNIFNCLLQSFIFLLSETHFSLNHFNSTHHTYTQTISNHTILT